jgi:hypothetical protein
VAASLACKSSIEETDESNARKCLRFKRPGGNFLSTSGTGHSTPALSGDAFIGSFASFATFLGEGLQEGEAVKRANLYAGLSTTGVGAQKSFYDRARFDAEWSARGKS